MKIYRWIVRMLLACVAIIGLFNVALWVALVREAFDALMNSGEWQ